MPSRTTRRTIFEEAAWILVNKVIDAQLKNDSWGTKDNIFITDFEGTYRLTFTINREKKESMNKPTNFKVGDKFILARPNEEDIRRGYTKGQIVELKEDDGSDCPSFWNAYKTEYRFIDFDRLDPLPKTLENLEVGDVVIDEDDHERKVLAVLPGVVLLSCYNHFEIAGPWYTQSELKKYGFTVKGVPEEVTEVTLEQVAKAMNIPLEKLRIKESK